MSHTTRNLVLAAAILSVVPAAAPAEADWFGISISNHGVSLGFGTSSWGLWGSSWAGGGWSTGFEAALSGYGEWVRVDGIGRVWRPWVAAGWQPYSHGRWVWTSLGWTWVSYEPWGWAPHHYGHWAMTTVGWVWAPGYTYHPGNVVWVRSGGYVGWYPCAPRGWSHAHRASHHGWSDGYAHGRHDGYHQGYADGWRDARYATWVPWSAVGSENISRHVVNHGVATRGVSRASVVATTTAPSRTEVERRIGRQIPEAGIVERKATIDGREVRTIRPEGQSRVVERHAGATVERALSPTARERVKTDSLGRSPASSSTSQRVRPSSSSTSGRTDAVQPRSRSTSTVERSTSRTTSASSEHGSQSDAAAGTRSSRVDRTVKHSRPAASAAARPSFTARSTRSRTNTPGSVGASTTSRTSPRTTSRTSMRSSDRPTGAETRTTAAESSRSSRSAKEPAEHPTRRRTRSNG